MVLTFRLKDTFEKYLTSLFEQNKVNGENKIDFKNIKIGNREKN